MSPAMPGAGLPDHPGLLSGGYEPGRFPRKFGGFAHDDGVAGMHLFTFNQIREAEEWRRCAL